jgi:CRISPR-associated protein Cmr5
MSDDRNLDQRRAAHALEKIEQTEERLSPDLQDKYRSYIDGLPANIVQNGLGQAAAMLLASADGENGDTSAHRQLYNHLEKWLCRGADAAPFDSGESLVEAITRHDQQTYVRAQTEALAWLKWGKKFARARLDKNTGGGADG